MQENVVLTGCSRDGIFISDHTLNQQGLAVNEPELLLTGCSRDGIFISDHTLNQQGLAVNEPELLEFEISINVHF